MESTNTRADATEATETSGNQSTEQGGYFQLVVNPEDMASGKVPLFINVSENYSMSCDVPGLVARIIVESGEVDLHGDILFYIDDSHRALLLRLGKIMVVEMLHIKDAPYGVDLYAQDVKLQPLIIQPEFSRANIVPKAITFKSLTRGFVEWTETSIKLVDGNCQLLAEYMPTEDEQTLPYRVILDNSEVRKYSPEIHPDAIVNVCPLYEKKYGNNSEEIVQYAQQLYICMSLVPHLEYSFMDKIRGVDIRGARHGRILYMTLHAGNDCAKCYCGSGKTNTNDDILLSIDIDHVTLTAKSLHLKKKEGSFVSL